VMRCPPQIAKELIGSLLHWLNSSTPTGAANCPSLCRSRASESSILDQRFDEDVEPETADEIELLGNPWLNSSGTSSGMSSGQRDFFPRQKPFIQDTSAPEQGPSPFSERVRDGKESVNAGRDSAEVPTLPWIAAADTADMDSDRLTRVLELGDATVLFRHFPVRAIVSVIVALMEERSVCIVGPNTAIVTRAVIAFESLLRPFKWPHCMSPILLQHMLPILGAPFPFFVGMLSCHAEQVNELPLDEVIFQRTWRLVTSHYSSYQKPL